MSQFQGVPGPSQDDFNTLSDQIGTYTKFFSGLLTWDGSGFPVTKSPIGNKGYSIIARNETTGAVYVLYYRHASTDFRIAATISGNNPSTNDAVYVFYPVG